MLPELPRFPVCLAGRQPAGEIEIVSDPQIKQWPKPVLRTLSSADPAAGFHSARHPSCPACSAPKDGQVANDFQTITLRGKDIQAAAPVLRALVDVEPDLGPKIAPWAHQQADSLGERSELIERARQTYANRARRARIFSAMMFGEVAWNMLLILYVSDQSGSRHTVSDLTNMSGAPQTTALRWLGFLENTEGLVRRKPKPTDRRIFMVELTDKAREALDAYFSEVIDACHTPETIVARRQ